MNETTKRTSKKAGVKITPKPKFKKQGVDFADLSINAWFIYNNTLCIKVDDDYTAHNQTALDTTDGRHFSDLCGVHVLPVDVEIKWKLKS